MTATLVSIPSATLVGVQGVRVECQVQVGAGMPGFKIIGLPQGAVREARGRILGALASIRMPFANDRDVTMHLAPAELRKDSAAFDLPLAVGLAVGLYQLPRERLGRHALLGELGLDGRLRPVRGVLPAALMAAREQLEGVIVPPDNAPEAAMAGVQALCADTLSEVIAWARGERELARVTEPPPPAVQASAEDLSDVRGQEQAKEAVEISAAGGHNLILVGPPGCGKTLLARRLPGLLPPLSREEVLEVSAVYSAAGLLARGGMLRHRPFRAPHHTISHVGLSGGGTPPRPGELSLAHGGVLFLDELPEFRPQALDTLRQPLEEGRIRLARAGYSIELPARVTVIGAMNPCPCGWYGTRQRTCTCSPSAVERYRGRISGPLLDRIDLHVEVQPVDYRHFTGPRGPGSTEARARVLRARAIQAARLAPFGLRANAEIPPGLLDRLCPLPADAHCVLERCVRLIGLTARAVDRLRRVARTIADLDLARAAAGAGGEAEVGEAEVSEPGAAGPDRSAAEAAREPLRALHVQRAVALRALDRPAA